MENELMPQSPVDPSYNLGFIIRETGIKADTLRTWERRYGLPRPSRSPGGHRLYSQRDLETVRWLAARQAEGMRISRAVALWKELEAHGEDPLSAGRPPSRTALSPKPAEALKLDSARRDWIAACLAFDEAMAEQVLNQAFSMYPLEAVCEGVLQQGLRDIGERWYHNRITVHQEHFTSVLTIRRLLALTAAASAPIHPERVLLACPTGELHVVSLMLLGLYLRRRGWEVYDLGADVPLARLVQALEQIRPDFVVLVAQQLHTASALYQIARELRGLDLIVGFGGRVFNQQPVLQSRIPGLFLGTSLPEGVASLEGWRLARPALPEPPPADPENRQALHAFLHHQPFVEADVMSAISGELMGFESVRAANENLARNLKAALTLGDLTLLDAEFEWLERLLGHYDSNGHRLERYLDAYAAAIQTHSGEDGRPITTYLRQAISIHRTPGGKAPASSPWTEET